MSAIAPIILFTYNRPWHTEQTLLALEKNELAQDSSLYIYADGAKENANEEQLRKIAEVRGIIKRNWKFKEIQVVERTENWGLADNIVDGVTKIVNQFGKIIVLEDDIVTSIGFLKYMNDALTLYESEEKVMHISGYMFSVSKRLPETFFYNTASCWGWATWKTAWQHFNFDAKELQKQIAEKDLVKKFNIEDTYPFYEHLLANATGSLKTWAVRWYASFFLKEGYALHPYPSLVNNIGHDGQGENSGKSNIFDWGTIAENVEVRKIKIVENKYARNLMRVYNRKLRKKKNSPNLLVMRLKRFIPSVLQHQYRLKKYTEYKDRYEQKQELERIKKIPRYQLGTTKIFGSEVSFVDSASFHFIFNELFQQEIYRFQTDESNPYIIDAGANIGLATIYFKQLYPQARIVAFEPDLQVYDILEKNINSFGYDGVQLVRKGLWDKETTLMFKSEGADGGRAALKSDKTDLVEIQTTSLRPYLSEKVDLLKIDIEGAETKVLEDCADLLVNVERIFVEYHSFIESEQSLNKLLTTLTDAHFRYYISHIGIYSPQPLLKKHQFAGMDNQLNIFAVREQNQ